MIWCDILPASFMITKDGWFICVTFHLIIQRRFQDFLNGAPFWRESQAHYLDNNVKAKPHYLDNFSWKLHVNEENLAEEGRVRNLSI